MSSFRKLLVKELDNVKRLQSTLDLSGEASIVQGKKVLRELKSQLNQHYDALEAEPRKTQAHTSLLAFRRLSTKVIRSTFMAISRHETQVAEGQRVNDSKS